MTDFKYEVKETKINYQTNLLKEKDGFFLCEINDLVNDICKRNRLHPEGVKIMPNDNGVTLIYHYIEDKKGKVILSDSQGMRKRTLLKWAQVLTLLEDDKEFEDFIAKILKLDSLKDVKGYDFSYKMSDKEVEWLSMASNLIDGDFSYMEDFNQKHFEEERKDFFEGMFLAIQHHYQFNLYKPSPYNALQRLVRSIDVKTKHV